jgi:hypothetical protein
MLLGVEKRGSDWVGRNVRPPSPVFLQMFILKGFKFNVLELLIPESLRARFLEMRILKGIVANELAETRLQVSFNTEGTEFTEFGPRKADRREMNTRRVDGGVDDEENMGKGSIALAQR